MSELLEALREKVSLSCRILAMEGLVEGILGHVSVRIPNNSGMFIRCRGEDEYGVLFTKKSDIRRVDFDGKGEELGTTYEVPKELPIHGEIYKSRPEIGCVIHAHPPAAVMCSILNLEFRPIFGAFNIPAVRMAINGIPIYSRSFLVTRPDQVWPIIESMGDKNICVLKGHGIIVCGKTVEEATSRALDFNVLARVTLMSGLSGRQVDEISEEDIAELPDLGSTFNNNWVWRHYVKMLDENRVSPNYWR